MASGPGSDHTSGNRLAFGANPSPPSFVTSFNNSTRQNEMTSSYLPPPTYQRICRTDIMGLEIGSEELRRFLLNSVLQVARFYQLRRLSRPTIIRPSPIPVQHLDQCPRNSKSYYSGVRLMGVDINHLHLRLEI